MNALHGEVNGTNREVERYRSGRYELRWLRLFERLARVERDEGVRERLRLRDVARFVGFFCLSFRISVKILKAFEPPAKRRKSSLAPSSSTARR